MSEVSVFLCLLFPLSHHPGLKGHTEFSWDEEVSMWGGVAAEMSSSLTPRPSLGDRGGACCEISKEVRMCVCVCVVVVVTHQPCPALSPVVLRLDVVTWENHDQK